MTIAFQAYSKTGSVSAPTPREAAIRFFQKYPTARKCDIWQGTTDGQCFTVTFRLRDGIAPQSWLGITKKTLDTLPTETGEA